MNNEGCMEEEALACLSVMKLCRLYSGNQFIGNFGVWTGAGFASNCRANSEPFLNVSKRRKKKTPQAGAKIPILFFGFYFLIFYFFSEAKKKRS